MTIPGDQAASEPDHYRYGGATLHALSAAISEERFATYLKLAESDRRRALELYTYNVALGSAFYGPLQALEVTLRNAVHGAMGSAGGPLWFETRNLRKPQRDALARARERLVGSSAQDPGRIVAGLSFGFWVALFAKKYESVLWRTVLYKVFAPVPARGHLHNRLNGLLTLRNRIAHHEPIVQRQLHADHDTILWVLEMLSPQVADWVRHHSRVPTILGQPTNAISYF